MRILIAGNLVNFGFFLAIKLRELNVNVDLLMENDPSSTADPFSTGLIKEKYPEWIKFYYRKKWKWKLDVIKKMREYDLIIGMTELAIFSFLSLKPYIAITTGADTRELIHSKSIKGILLRMAYRFAKIVVYVMPTQFPIIKKNKIRRSVFIPIFKKTWNYSKVNRISKKKFSIFHPTNHIWKDKRNDIFLNAFIELAKKRDDVYLITLNRGIDAKKSIKLLKSGNIEGRYEIINSTLIQKEMLEYYQKCDLVADQFRLGSIGLIGIDCLSIGKPLISYINEILYEKAYGEKPPVISSQDSKTLSSLMNKIIEDKTMYKEIGKKSKDWYQKFHSEDVLIKKYKTLIEMVMQGKNSEQIQSKLDFVEH